MSPLISGRHALLNCDYEIFDSVDVAQLAALEIRFTSAVDGSSKVFGYREDLTAAGRDLWVYGAVMGLTGVPFVALRSRRIISFASIESGGVSRPLQLATSESTDSQVGFSFTDYPYQHSELVLRFVDGSETKRSISSLLPPKLPPIAK